MTFLDRLARAAGDVVLRMLTPPRTEVDAVLEREARIIGSRSLLKGLIDKAPADSELVLLIFPREGVLDYHGFDADDALGDDRIYFLLAGANRLILDGALGVAVYTFHDPPEE